jgi:phage terminase large subunit-like protein
VKDASLDLGTLSTAELAALKKKATDQLADTHRRGRFALFKPLEHQRPWFASKKQILAAIGGNQMGKTTCGAIRLLSGALGTFPPSLGGTIPASWERLDCRGQRYLMVAESFNTVIAKTIFPKVNEYLTQEMQSRPPKKNAGTKLPEIIYLRSGAEIHVQSYEQDPASFEGPTWDGVWFDEPPPQAVFNAVRRGTIAKKGWIWLTATPLREAWVRDMIVMPAQDDDDPMNEFADVFGGKMHDNCADCYGGYLPHAYIVAYLASLPPEERAVRERGEFFNVSDLAFGNLSEQLHVVGDLW